jgi:integrase
MTEAEPNQRSSRNEPPRARSSIASQTPPIDKARTQRRAASDQARCQASTIAPEGVEKGYVDRSPAPATRRTELTHPTPGGGLRLSPPSPKSSASHKRCRRARLPRSFSFAAFTGARKSECFAIRWSDVDLTRGKETARVVRQFYKGELVDETKTPAGAREIILAPRAARALRELSVAQQVDERENPHGLVFPSPRGSYWLDSNFDRRVWQKARTKAKLPELTFHTLRYFYISMVRAQGLPNAITEQLVGHVDERTHRGYTRPIPGTEPLIRAALGSAQPGSAQPDR